MMINKNVLLLVLGSLVGISAFTPTPTTKTINISKNVFTLKTRNNMVVNKDNGDDEEEEDPTKVWYADIANTVQNLLTNSPLNEGKKAVVKMLAGDYDKDIVRGKIDDLIANEKAKQILDAKKVKYYVVELNVIDDGPAIRAEMADIIGRTSVPAIWIGGTFIGGCNDGPEKYGGLNTINNNGILDTMLSSVGAV